MSLNCRNAVELLPWLYNGTLEEGEEGMLRAHLSACESCRLELGKTAEAWRLLTRHIPSLSLAEYSQGLPSSGLDRERIERHLALCPSCCRELEWAMSESLVDFAAARAARTASPDHRRDTGSDHRLSRWRHLAIAAGIAAVLASGGWAWTLLSPPVATSDLGNRASQQQGEISTDPALDRQPIEQSPPAAAVVLYRDGFESGDMTTWSQSQIQQRSAGRKI